MGLLCSGRERLGLSKAEEEEREDKIFCTLPTLENQVSLYFFCLTKAAYFIQSLVLQCPNECDSVNRTLLFQFLSTVNNQRQQRWRWVCVSRYRHSSSVYALSWWHTSLLQAWLHGDVPAQLLGLWGWSRLACSQPDEQAEPSSVHSCLYRCTLEFPLLPWTGIIFPVRLHQARVQPWHPAAAVGMWLIAMVNTVVASCNTAVIHPCLNLAWFYSFSRPRS